MVDGELADKNPHRDSEQIVEVLPRDVMLHAMRQYCNEIPQIERVLTIDGEHLTIELREGTFSGTWKECKSI